MIPGHQLCPAIFAQVITPGSCSRNGKHSSSICFTAFVSLVLSTGCFFGCSGESVGDDHCSNVNERDRHATIYAQTKMEKKKEEREKERLTVFLF